MDWPGTGTGTFHTRGVPRYPAAMDLGLQDKVVWVTGASGGIGRAVAETFADEGARVALHANRGVEEARDWLSRQTWSERGLVVQADVRDAQALEGCAAAIVELFGRIDICIANAGVWPAGDLLLDELPVERLQDTLAVNLSGSLYTVRAFMQQLRLSGPRADGHGAAVIFVGSTAGQFGECGHVDYAASKAGLIGAMKSLKNEVVQLDPYARVNVVEPGWTVTHMARPALDQPGTVERVTRTMALRQLGRAKDIARAICVLASPLASAHITGQVLTVAGGMEGRLLWNEDDVDRDAVLARLTRD